MTAFFKKEIPKTPIYLPNGSKIQFEPRDTAIGFFKTDQDATIAALEKLQAEHRGGVFKITEAEYEAGKKKAGSTALKPAWREEIGQGSAQDTMLKRHAPPPAPAAVKPLTADSVGTDQTIEKPKRPPVKPPMVGKRPLV